MKTESAKTAKMIREALKELFPSVKFSVRSSNFSMGNSVDVSWTDGPVYDMVNNAINRFQSGDFDGMTDCYNYRQDRPDHPTSKYVHSSREISKALAEYTLNYFKTKWADGWPECGLEIVDKTSYSGKIYWDFSNDSPMPNGNGYRSHEVNRYASHIAVNAKGEYVHDTSWYGFAHERKQVA